jgi:hypothetical protein
LRACIGSLSVDVDFQLRICPWSHSLVERDFR